MAKKKKKNSLDTARDLADILLYKATGGTMGKACEAAAGDVSFVEIRGLLDTILRIHALELKGDDSDEDEESAFDIIKREAKNGSKKAKSGSFEATNQYFADAKRAENARNGTEDE